MKNKHLLSLVTSVALLMITSTGYSQNVGIGQSAPISKLDIKGNLTVGADYSGGTPAPINGAIIEGNVGIGNPSPSSLLTIGTSAPVTVDNSGDVTISSFSSGSVVVTGTGGLLQIISVPELANTYLEWNGSAYTWATATSSMANLTPGGGLTGAAYNGSSAQTWDVTYGSSLGTAVQGNTTLTVSPGTGMSGGGTITLGTGGTITLANTGILSIGVTSPISSTGGTTPTISLGTVGVANGGTGLTSVGGNGTVLEVVSGAPAWTTITAASTNAWGLSGNGGTTAGTNYIGTTDGNDLVFKTDASENMRLSNSTGNVVIGSGEGGSAVGNIIRAPYNNSGGNRTGADFTIAAGAPTGKGGSGSIIFQELAANVGSPGSTSDLSIMAEVMRITNTGALSFGSTGTATGSANDVLISGGSATNPSWGQIGLTTSVTGILPVVNGGTGDNTLTTNGLLYGNSTSPVNETTAGTVGEVLTAGVTGAPTWTSAGSVAELLTVNVAGGVTWTSAGTAGQILSVGNAGDLTWTPAGTVGEVLTANVTGATIWSTATYPATTTINQLLYSSSTNTVTGLATANNGVLITSASGVPSIETTLPSTVQGNITAVGTITSGTWTGTTIAVAHGGTGVTSLTSNGILYGGATVGATAAGATGQLLTTSSGTPVWTTATYPATTTANQLLYSSATSTVTGLATANNGVLITSAAGVPSIGTTLPSAVQGNITTVGTITSGTWNGTTIAVANGGTGLTTFGGTNTILYTTTANNLSSITTADNGILLTSASGVPSIGSTLPSAVQGNITTVGTITSGTWTGTTIAIANGGTGQTSANAALNAFLPSQTGKTGDFLTTSGTNSSWAAAQAPITLTTTGTGAATFSSNTLNIPIYQAAGTYVTGLSVTTNQGVSGSFTAGATPALTLDLGALTGATSYNGLVVTANTGVITTGTWNGTAIGAAYGGTGQTSYTVGDMLYASGATTLSKTNAAAAGQVLIGDGTTPTFTTLSGDIGAITSAGAVTVDGILGKTISPTTVTSGQVLEYNGTNWVPTTPNSGVTSITAGTGLTGGTITTTGTISIGTVPVANGGTGLTTAPANGQLLIGNGTGYTIGTITAGTGITVTNTAGAITITNTGSGSSQWTTSGANIYNNNTGNVGISTNAPATQLDVNGDFSLRDTAITVASGTTTLTPNGYSFVRFTGTGSGNVTINTINGGVNGKILIIYDTNATMILGKSGNILGWDTYASGGVFNAATLIYSATDSKWIIIAGQ